MNATPAAPDAPLLVTERLVLRMFCEADLDVYAAWHADAETMRYIGSGETLSRADAWRGMARVLGHWELRGFGLWAVEERATGALVGRVGFNEPEGWPGFEVGWLIGREHRGRGFATEAAEAALAHAFGAMDRDHVISVIHPDNHASIRVAERLGETFERELVLRSLRVLVYGRGR